MPGIGSPKPIGYTRATQLLNDGVPFHVVQRYLGHQRPNDRRYAATLTAIAEAEFLKPSQSDTCRPPIESGLTCRSARSINRLTTISPTAERLFEGRATTVIDGGCVIDSKLRRLGLRRSQLEHAVRLQNGNAIGQIDYGRLEPGGQLVLTLKHTEQAATKADVAELIDRLSRVEDILTIHR